LQANQFKESEDILHGRLPRELRKNLLIDNGKDSNKSMRATSSIARAIIEGAANMWRAQCTLASGPSVTGVALGKKVRQFAKVNALLHELSNTRIGFLRDSTTEDIIYCLLRVARNQQAVESYISSKIFHENKALKN
jgi:hypothetical protein